jgi:hypothetical protein
MFHLINAYFIIFSFKIRKQYTDCLSRQVGEAIAILLSKDQLLNSKNEYVQNCISRITIQEDSLERKQRIIREEAEEKKEETALAEFKAKKRADSKRKDEDLIGNPSKRGRFSSQEEDTGRKEDEEKSTTEGGIEKLRILRQRMETEKARITNLMDTRRQEDILQVIHTLWKNENEEISARRKIRTYHLIPTGWKEWWLRVETEAESEIARSRLSKSKIKQIDFRERTLPNILLTGWRGWWARMEAEAIKDSKQKDMEGNTHRITDFFKPGRMTPMRFKETSGRVEDADTGSYQTPGTPKRKLIHTLMGESPLKRRKINFVKPLPISKSAVGGKFSNSRTVPIDIALRDFKPNSHGPAKLRSDNDSEVVAQQDSPGLETDSSCTDMQPGCETSL